MKDKILQESTQLCLACFLDEGFILACKSMESTVSRSFLFNYIINKNVQSVVKLPYG